MMHLSKFHEALKKLKENGPGRLYAGICGNLSEYSLYGYGPVEWWMNKLSPSWPRYSGEKGYPVPKVSDEFGTAYEAYEACVYQDAMWDRSTEYGRLRWELLDFLIAESGRLLGESL